MSSELRYFWLNKGRKFHAVYCETPEKRYSFYCGETGEWGNIGTLEQALEQNLRICEGCLVTMPKEKVRELTQHS